jgi:hypothetical protein
MEKVHDLPVGEVMCGRPIHIDYGRVSACQHEQSKIVHIGSGFERPVISAIADSPVKARVD